MTVVIAMVAIALAALTWMMLRRRTRAARAQVRRERALHALGDVVRRVREPPTTS